jgi:hypothetical protein
MRHVAPSWINNQLFFLPGKELTVFFPGDLMDKQENMNIYKQYSIENTAQILQRQLDKAVLVICPAEKVRSQAVYSNFIHYDSPSVPNYAENMNASKTIQSLIRSVSKEDSPIQILGFSRGCTVLNQLISEWSRDSSKDDLLDRLTGLWWIDAGNGQIPGAYQTNPIVVDNFCSRVRGRGISIQIMRTPYQMSRYSSENEAVSFIHLLLGHYYDPSLVHASICLPLYAANLSTHFAALDHLF